MFRLSAGRKAQVTVESSIVVFEYPGLASHGVWHSIQPRGVYVSEIRYCEVWHVDPQHFDVGTAWAALANEAASMRLSISAYSEIGRFVAVELEHGHGLVACCGDTSCTF